MSPLHTLSALTRPVLSAATLPWRVAGRVVGTVLDRIPGGTTPAATDTAATDTAPQAEPAPASRKVQGDPVALARQPASSEPATEKPAAKKPVAKKPAAERATAAKAAPVEPLPDPVTEIDAAAEGEQVDVTPADIADQVGTQLTTDA